MVLLVVYIGLGLMEFWSGRKRGIRIVCWLTALAVYLFISVARTHDPLGILALARA